jgi:hypothetical protein
VTRIVVDLGWLRGLQADMTATTERMSAASEEAVDIPSRPDVDGDTTDFMNKWDERRGDLAECLDALDGILTAVIDSFDYVNQALADATGGGDGP